MEQNVNNIYNKVAAAVAFADLDPDKIQKQIKSFAVTLDEAGIAFEKIESIKVDARYDLEDEFSDCFYLRLELCMCVIYDGIPTAIYFDVQSYTDKEHFQVTSKCVNWGDRDLYEFSKAQQVLSNKLKQLGDK